MVLCTPTHRDASADMRVSFHFRDVRQILFAVGLGRERCVAGAYFNVQWSIFVGVSKQYNDR